MNLDKVKWSYLGLESRSPIWETKILFKRIDKKRIKEEREKLLTDEISLLANRCN